MKFLFTVLVLSALVAAPAKAENYETQSRNISTQPFEPKWQGRPILAMAHSERQKPALSRVEAALKRASLACNLLKLPEGRFSVRQAESVQTKGFDRKGKLAVVEKKADGSISAKMVDVPENEFIEVIRSIRCVGVY